MTTTTPNRPTVETAIDTADHIRHAPSGEDWVVAYVRGDRLVCCGWPESMAALADCTLIKKATPAERDKLLADMADCGGSRGAYAIERLRAATSLAPCLKGNT